MGINKHFNCKTKTEMRKKNLMKKQTSNTLAKKKPHKLNHIHPNIYFTKNKEWMRRQQFP